VILPGPEISAYVLNERTDRLPSTHWDPARQFTYPATNTHDGIQLGIKMGLVGAVLAVYFNIVSTQQASVENCPEIIIPKKWSDSLVTDSIHGITQKDEENKDPELPVILITGHGCGQLNQYLRRCFAQFQYNGKPMQPVIRNCPEIILSGLFQILDQLMSNQTKSCFDGNI
ncbi:MAG: type III pantothenate kinase, partial [Thermoguttaceae bacterium]|nr:type III pantothenate kinase [Thermoguttaceae bacterium]